MAAKEIDADRINGWLENGKDEEYEIQSSMLKNVLENTPHLKYLYIYQIKPDGCHVVFDTDPEEPGMIGDIQAFDDSFSPYIPTLLKGEHINTIESRGAFGWLLTYYEPIYDSTGECVAYAGADISMDEIYEYLYRYVLIIIMIALVFLVACVFVGLKMSISSHKADELDRLREQQQRDK